MDVVPEGLTQLLRSDDLAGMSEEKLKGGEFFGGEMNRGFIAIEDAVRFKTEAAEGESGAALRMFRAGR